MYPSGYKADKIYSLKPTDGSGDFDFTRASTATRVNADGLIESVASGVPRIDYTGGGCGKLLLEPQRSNLATFSEDFDNVVYGKENITILPNNTTSPDGTTNADKINELATNNFHALSRAFNISSGIYTISIFAKADERDYLIIRTNLSGVNVNTTFDLLNGVVTYNGHTSASIEMYNNNWYRCIITSNTNLTSISTAFLISNINVTNNNLPTYLGDGTSGIHVWGAQLEEGSYPTSYIPTAGATATRVADDCQKTGISSLIGQTEGTLFLEFEYTYNDGIQVLIKANQINDDNSVGIELTSSTIRALVRSGVTAVADISETISFGKVKAAIAYKSNDFAFYVNGIQAGTDTSGTISWGGVVDMLTIGKFNLGGIDYFRSSRPFNKALVFKTRLTNTSLEELTSWTSFIEMAKELNYKTY